MTFGCTGLINRFIFGAILLNGNQAPEFQIWNRIGQNGFRKTSTITIRSNTMIGTNLYEFVPQFPEVVFEGYIFGLYVPRANSSQILIHEQELSGPVNLRSVPESLFLLEEGENNFPLVTPVVSCIFSGNSVSAAVSTYISTYISKGTIYTTITESSTGITSGLSTSSINSSSYRTSVTTTSFSSNSESSTETLSGSTIVSSSFETTITLSTSTIPTPTGEEGLNVLVAMFGGIAIGMLLIVMVMIIICLCIVFKRTRKPTSRGVTFNDDSNEPQYESIQFQSDIEITTEINQCYGVAGELSNQLYSTISDEPAVDSSATATITNEDEEYI
ncbi:PREDICTED: uncharacterized protein LOC109582603 [Amphimedon queenslandica]|uniref:Uncharacterized protein n=1 Tax=Amphimedon queenslandica TaxID=400682 RepID=A0AAN0J7H9_AMPQE|nr:PREDICTED: uncharacterized protein LOC109582603 [Amphimedon queenslandica]|eukprot:XP_019852980.1 PREDICTED: uncharacterized protein LOC109582603 [Amphimedon queenslandica]